VQQSSIDVLASALQGTAETHLGEMSSPDGALTLLFCDIADVEAIRQALAPERLQSLLADQHTVVRRIADHHAAQIARSHEDGFMIAFDSAHAALHCAIDMQRAFVCVTVDETSTTLELRVGVHTGFVIGAGEDLYGRNVLLAARIAGEAGGGEIMVSAKVKEYTETDPGFRFTDRGERHFKGLHGEHDLFALEWREPGQAPDDH
jgi:adenylate cyclase